MRLESHQAKRRDINRQLSAAGMPPTLNLQQADGTGRLQMPALYRAAEHTSAAPNEDAALSATPPPLSVIAWNRIAFGPRPGDIDTFNAMPGADDSARLAAFVDQQLDPAGISDTDLDTRLADPAYTTLGKTLTQLWADHVNAPEGTPWQERIRPAMETQYAAFVRGVYSNRQLIEVLADFWHNHFNIYSWDMPMAGVWVHYDRDVIRPHLLGNFRDMLYANAKSTAMLYYLDNVDSSDAGPNENYGRELLELHTMGAENYLGVIPQWEVPVDGAGRPVGYVEGDVLEVARCFTGWSVANGHWSDPTDPDNGEFRYRDFWHDRFQKYFLQTFFPADQADLVDGERVLDMLAEHPGTATFISRKLCRRFIADFPPESIVTSAAQVFHDNWEAPDQLKQVVRHILLSAEFQSTWGQKIKRPFENVVGAMRACEADITLKFDDGDSNTFRWLFDNTGHYPYSWGPPNGYPDFGSVWQGTTALVMSWRTVNWLLNRPVDGVYAVGTPYYLDVVAATLAEFPDPATRTPNNLAQFWVERILGYAPDPALAANAAALLDHSDAYGGNWDPDTPIDLTLQDEPGQGQWPHYWQSGLRAMIGLILMSPEFLQR